MREAEYSEAAVEVLDILNHTNKDDVKKIPQSFIKFLTDISSKSYKSKFNHELPINGFNLRKQTKELLGFIYITWWCNKEEYEKYKRKPSGTTKKTENLSPWRQGGNNHEHTISLRLCRKFFTPGKIKESPCGL